MLPLDSARLVFRSWTVEDTALAEALWCDPEVTQHFGGAMTTEQARDRLHAERERGDLMGIQYWPMFLRETGEFAGCAGLRPWSLDPSTIEAGVHLMRSVWGLRLGEEALLGILAHGFDALSLPKIVAGHGIEHRNSRKLLERVGFQYTHDILWSASEIKVCMWEITAEVWRQRRSVQNQDSEALELEPPPRTQVEHLRARGSRVETIFPDSDSLDALGMGMNLMDLSTRRPSAQAGYNQGKAIADQLSEFWR